MAVCLSIYPEEKVSSEAKRQSDRIQIAIQSNR